MQALFFWATLLFGGHYRCFWLQHICYALRAKQKYLFCPYNFSVFYFGWSVIEGAVFVYVLPVAPFLFVLLSNLLFDLYKKKAPLFFGWIVLALAVFFFFYPLWVGRPISEKYFRATQWLPDWKKINIIDKENPSTS